MHIRPCFRWWLLILVVCVSAASFAQIAIVVSFAPPPLPVYEQPLCPGEGYIWVPGYWAYDNGYEDYYWVPGTWVLAPAVGLLWTPPYWGWNGSGFAFFHGYWGPQVGFYGGIVYGYGYFGHGYEGGRWNNGQFYYNRSVNNVNVTNIHNVYNTTVVNNTTVNHVSYNGGNGGINARATPAEEAAMQERHLPSAAGQTQQIEAARANPQLRASVNQGKPPVAATPKPAAFNERGVVPAKAAGGTYQPPANRAAKPAENAAAPHPENAVVPHPENTVPHPPTPAHAKELPSHTPATPPNTGNPETEQKYQRQQQKLAAKQDQEHQKLAQQQEQEHQKLAQQQANEARTQQMEQQHQQQTQQMEENHARQQQALQARQQPAVHNPPPAPSHAEAARPPK